MILLLHRLLHIVRNNLRFWPDSTVIELKSEISVAIQVQSTLIENEKVPEKKQALEQYNSILIDFEQEIERVLQFRKQNLN